jgi:hypothetical protein
MKRTISAIAAGGSLVGALFLTLSVPVPHAGAQSASGGITDLSSQHDPRVSAAKGVGRGGGPPPGAAGGRGGGGGPPPGLRPPGPRGPAFNPGAGAAPRVFQGGGQRGPVGVVGPVPRGPAGVIGSGYRGPAIGFRPSWRGGRAAFVRGPYRVRRGGLLLPLVGLGALGAIYVGSRAYTPYAYVDGPVGPECAGPTDDGLCELRMTEVPLESGGAEAVCVAYCPPQ